MWFLMSQQQPDLINNCKNNVISKFALRDRSCTFYAIKRVLYDPTKTNTYTYNGIRYEVMFELISISDVRMFQDGWIVNAVFLTTKLR